MNANPPEMVTFRPPYAREFITVPKDEALARGYRPPEPPPRAAPTVVISAPAGAGKTRYAAALAAMFGCTCVIDEWDGVSPLPAGALALTHEPLSVAQRPGAA